MFRIAPESGLLLKLSAEGLVISGVVLIALILMSNPKKGAIGGHNDDISRFDIGYLRSVLLNKAGVASMGAGFVAAAVLAMIFGQSDLPGQSVGVGFFAGIGGGLAGALVASSMGTGKHVPTPFAPIMIGVMLCSVLMPVIGMITPGAGGLVELVQGGKVPGYLIVTPIAWVMGALLGVPVGHSWVEHSVQQAGDGHGARA